MLDDSDPADAKRWSWNPSPSSAQVPGPVVYGYMRLPSSNPARRAALARTLRGYCDKHELVLAGVFTDSGDEKAWTPGFASLVDAILTDGSYGVVVPSLAHLGARQLATQRSAAITRTGRRLMLMHSAPIRATAGRAW